MSAFFRLETTSSLSMIICTKRAVKPVDVVFKLFDHVSLVWLELVTPAF